MQRSSVSLVICIYCVVILIYILSHLPNLLPHEQCSVKLAQNRDGHLDRGAATIVMKAL